MAFEIQAHRGARALFPENTLQAFLHAAELGIRVLELDLVVSKDMQIVVSHDPWLSSPLCADPEGHPLSTEDRQRYILYDMMYDDIALFDCGLPNPSFPGQVHFPSFKPLLSKVFLEVDAYMASAGVKERMIYNLEIKSWSDKDGRYHPFPDRYAALVLQLVEAAGLSSRVRIQSFDFRVVREAWRLNPRLCYGLLIDTRMNPDRFILEPGFLPCYVNPHFTLVDQEMTVALHGQGIKMIPWTVNRTEEMLAMMQIGADGIITDYPERAIALFGLPA
jgi:glycerophosphoryl diester phosphodiesterase